MSKDSIKKSADETRKDVRRQIRENSVADFSFLFMNVMATIVASYGLLADSTAVVIGAMLIAALLGPITGIALGLVDGNRRLLRLALTSEAVGVAVVLLTALVIGWIHNEIPIGREITSRTSPNITDLIIALAGGAAGAYATTTPRISSGLIGVAISTALVPPLATCAILLARGQYDTAFGGFLLFFANFVAIQFSSSVVLWLAGFRHLTRRDQENTKQIYMQSAVSVGVLVVLTFTLGVNFINSARKQRFERDVRRELRRAVEQFPTTSVSEVNFQDKEGKNLVTAVLRTPFVFSKEQVAQIEKTLPKLTDQETELHIRSVITTETTREGNIDPTNDNENNR